MIIEIPSGVRKIIDRLNSRGYRADIVGGAVRDAFLSRETNDYDVTTNALPETVKEIFADERTVDTGIKHGTVSIIIDGECYEVTTWRVDGEYRDSRHPETVTFTPNIEDDLARRDFTMNSIAYNPNDGLTDPFFGKEDIDARIIRTVGEAEVRFSEDALRILRALRFSSVLGFRIEESTRVGINAKGHLLRNVSPERIYQELTKLLSGELAYSVIADYKDTIEIILPEVDILLLPFGSSCDPLVKLSAIFALNSENPAMLLDSAMRRLKTDNKSRKTYTDALTVYSERRIETKEDVLFILRDFGVEPTLRAVDIGVEVGRYGENEKKLVEDAIASGVPYTVGMLDIKGSDLIGIGITGEGIGRMLDHLLTLVINGEAENERASLLGVAEGK